MYATHVPIINSAMRQCPDTFARGIMFAVLSARQPFSNITIQMDDLAAKGEKSRYLFSWKKGCYQYVMANKRQLWRDTCAAKDSETALRILTKIPGLGIVKAAFVLQFIGHDIACLDVRNIVREGRNPLEFKSNGPKHKNSQAYVRLISRYVAETSGRAQELWDVWCADVAETYRMTPHDISEAHLKIVPCRLRSLPVVACPIITVNQIPF